MADEVPGKQSNEDSMLDDLFVPGIGVRGALADDDLEPSEFWSRARDGYARRMGVFGQWAGRTLKNVRLAGSREAVRFSARLSVRLSKIGEECRAAFSQNAELARHLMNSASRRLRKTHVRLAIGAHVAVLRFRNTINLGFRNTINVRLSPWLFRILQASRAHFLRGRQVAHLQVGRAGKHLHQVLKENIRYSRRAQVWLVATAADARDRVRVVGQFAADQLAVDLRISPDFRLNLSTLRRVAPALAALLIIAAFVVQATMVAAQR
jgi:hypothetical protein